MSCSLSLPPSLGALRLLLVEDCEDDAVLLCRQLVREGYELTSERVDTCEAMEAALERQTWDVVISDWRMPHFSAPEALEVLKSKELDLPFIIVSGTIGEEAAVAAMRAGAHDYLSKDRLTRLAPAVARELREANVRRERRKMQEQLMVSDRMASVGILAAGVGHEINNPLAAIVANLDVAMRDVAELKRVVQDRPELRDLLEELHDARESAERIRDIVRDLRIFSRPDKEERRPVDVHKLLDSSLRMAWAEIRNRARVSKRYSSLPLVDGNESRLGQVFLNLIVNAAQSIQEGRMDENQIVVATHLAQDGRVVVEVQDTGSGIAPELMRKLFAPFVTTKPAGVGTGLGLSICRRIVNSFGGEISVTSEVGKGSVFRVYLRAVQGVRLASTATRPAATAPSTRGSVLVIDDDPAIGVAVERVLGADHDVTIMTSASQALKALGDGSVYQVIVCDLIMPDMTGMDLHAELLRVAPEHANRMIFLSAGTWTPRARAFLDRMEIVHLEKPFDAVDLQSLVNERMRTAKGLS